MDGAARETGMPVVISIRYRPNWAALSDVPRAASTTILGRLFSNRLRKASACRKPARSVFSSAAGCCRISSSILDMNADSSPPRVRRTGRMGRATFHLLTAGWFCVQSSGVNGRVSLPVRIGKTGVSAGGRASSLGRTASRSRERSRARVSLRSPGASASSGSPLQLWLMDSLSTPATSVVSWNPARSFDTKR